MSHAINLCFREFRVETEIHLCLRYAEHPGSHEGPIIEKLPSGTITAIQWDCGCAWDTDAGLFICETHQEDPEA